MKQSLAALGLTLLFASQGANAVPLYNGTYGLADAGGAPNRGIWTNVGKFFTQSGSFSVTGDEATLQGSVFSNTYNGGLTFDVTMKHLCTSSVTDAGGRDVTVDNAACGLGLQPTGGAITGADADGNTWDFWNWAPSTLKGFGALDGLELGISQAPGGNTKPFRVGIAADWDDVNLLGASGWIAIDSYSCAAGAACQSSNFRPGKADFNFSFTTVPAPAPLALIALGLIGIGAARRRK